MPSTLYLIPPAEPDNLTLRAVRLLRESAIIVSDDVPNAARILQMLEIPTTLTPLPSIGTLLEFLKNGHGVIFARCIGDSAVSLVQLAIRAQVTVTPIPGAFAPLLALIRAGFANDSFIWIGDLPSVREQIETRLQPFTHERRTLILNLADSQRVALEVVWALLGARTAVLTQGDTLIRGSLDSLIEAGLGLPPGEITLVLEGASEQPSQIWDETQVRIALQMQLQEGASRRAAAKWIAARSGWDTRAVYDLSLDE